MKRRLDKNAGRRGIGIEMAVLVLLVVFGLSGLLVSTALLEKENLDREKAALAQRMELDKLAEGFCASPTADWELTHDNYVSQVTSENNLTTMHIYLKSDDPDNPDAYGPCLLTVVLKHNGTTYTVEQWTHH